MNASSELPASQDALESQLKSMTGTATEIFGIHKIEEKPLVPITCRYIRHGSWQSKTFANESMIRIGVKPDRCELVIQEIEDVQLCLRSVGAYWLVLDRGINRRATFNGSGQYEAVLLPDTTMVVTVGNVCLMLSASTSSESKVPPLPSDMIPSFSFRLTRGKDVFEFRKGKPALMGTHPDCDIKVSERQMAAIAVPGDGRVFAVSLDDDVRTAVGDDEFSGTEVAPIKPGQFLMVEGQPFKVDYVQGGSSKRCTGRLAITQIKKDGSLGMTIDLPEAGKSVSVGRAEDNWLSINCGQISSQHAQMIIYDSNIMVYDSESTNGTFINGERIKKKLAYPGDIIHFAGRLFLVRYNSA